MSDGASFFEELKNEFHPPLSPTLIATLLLDYDPAEPSSLSTIRSSLQILSEETQDPDAFYVTTSSEDESADEVQRMLETWSLDDSSMGFEFGEGSSSNGTSVSTGSEGDNVEFLRMLFPYSSISTLQDALDQNPAGDMTAIVEHLLSVAAIKEMEETGAFEESAYPASTKGGLSDAWAGLTQEEKDKSWEFGALEEIRARASKSKSSRTKKLAGKKTSVGAIPNGVLVRPSPSPASSSRTIVPTTRKRPQDANAWVDISALSQSLVNVLAPATPRASFNHFHSYIHAAAHGSSYSNILASLDGLKQPLPSEEPEFFHMLVFHDDIPSKRERDVLQLVWRAAGGEVDVALDLWNLLESVKERSGDNHPATQGLFVPAPVVAKVDKPVVTIRTSTVSAPAPPTAKRRKPVVSSHLAPTSRNPPTQPSNIPLPLSVPSSPVMSSKKLKGGFQIPTGRAQHTKFAPSKKTTTLHPLSESIPAYKGQGAAVAREIASGARASRKGGYTDLKEREARQRRLRDEALRRATRAFMSGNSSNYGRQIAQYHAEEARKHGDRIRQLGLQAAREQIRASPRTSTTNVDLHGLNLYEATHMTAEAIDAWWADTSLRGTPFNIITGRGLHSEQARAVLRPNISKMLKVNGWRVSEGTEGTLRVIGKA